jgi:hypothetical protein
MRRLTIAMMLVLALAAAALAQGADAQAKAEQILKQARAAIGDEAKIKNLQSLTATGTARQTMGERQMESELQIDLLMPDKIMLTNTSQFMTRVSTLNGDKMWNEFIPGMGMGGGGNVMRMGGPGGPGGPGSQAMADSPMGKYMQMNQRREILLVLIGWFLNAPASAQLQYAFAGEAPGPEGTKLNAISVKGPDDFNAMLYLDQQSNRLVGIKYKAKQMRRMFGGGRGQGGPGGPGGQGGTAGAGGGQRPPQAGAPNAQGGEQGQRAQRPEMTPEERERRMKEAQENFAKAPEVTYSWTFADYKSVGGLNLPHRLTKSEGDTPNEEWEISKIKLNTKLTPDKFEKKEKS